MACMCYECKFMKILRDNKNGLFATCTHRESDNFLSELDYAFDSCDKGIIDEEED